MNLWDVVHVELIGPYDGYYGITIIDVAKSWLKVNSLTDQNSLTTAESFDREWICRYPRPAQVIYELGAAVSCEEFEEL